MKRLLGILLVLGVMGCGSKKVATTPTKTPDAAAKNASTPTKTPDAAAKNASTPTKTPDAAAKNASTPTKAPDAAAIKKRMTPDQLALGDPFTNSVGMVLVPIPAGEFMMGEPTLGEPTIPGRLVTLTKPFHLVAFEVTQEQYEKVMGKNPSHFKGPNNPVEKVSWDDAVEFCRKLSELPEEKAAGHVYRLPTEAEWEYACRAGTTTTFSFGDDRSQLGEYAWFDENSGRTTHPVGEKKLNAWGLYDMHGNVWEWCQDWHGGVYPSEPVTDPMGATTGSVRECRGGYWGSGAQGCESGGRAQYPPTKRFFLGFRVARGPSASK
jgi:formylglycine-generating enzyme required for sulfatase activity